MTYKVSATVTLTLSYDTTPDEMEGDLEEHGGTPEEFISDGVESSIQDDIESLISANGCSISHYTVTVTKE